MSDLISRIYDELIKDEKHTYGMGEGTRDLFCECATEIDLMKKRIAELEAFRRAVVGWRENDWPVNFCSASADLLGERARHEMLTVELRNNKSPAVTDNEVCDE